MGRDTVHFLFIFCETSSILMHMLWSYFCYSFFSSCRKENTDNNFLVCNESKKHIGFLFITKETIPFCPHLHKVAIILGSVCASTPQLRHLQTHINCPLADNSLRAHWLLKSCITRSPAIWRRLSNEKIK